MMAIPTGSSVVSVREVSVIWCFRGGLARRLWLLAAWIGRGASRLRSTGMPARIEKALMNSYDVVVLDRDLPKVHGDAVCATLVGSRSAARILMLTAAATVGDRVQALRTGGWKRVLSRGVSRRRTATTFG